LIQPNLIKNPGHPTTCSTREKTQVKNPLMFFEFCWSKQGCFDIFFFNLGELGLTLQTREKNLAPSRPPSQVLRL